MATDGIARFWAWWPGGRGHIQAAIEGGGFDDAVVKEISARVAAIDEEIDWELAPGGTARHAFCLSAKGDPVKRRITERWLRAAPPADAIWEYHPARRGGRHQGDARFKIGGLDLRIGDFVAAFEIDETRELVNATCFHPLFPNMSEDLRRTATFLLLDDALGEDGVERWIGGIEAAAAPPAGAKPITELRAAIDRLATAATRGQYTLLKGADREGRPVVVVANLALKRIDHLDCDHHVEIQLAILNPTPKGMTGEAEAKDLDALEDELTPLLPDAVYFGRSTGRGRRVIRFFAPGGSPGRARLEEWVSHHRDRDARVSWTDDPRWDARDRLL